MTTLARVYLCALLLLPLLAQSKAELRYDVVPTPAWVVPAELPAHKLFDSTSQQGGTDYVLVDHQVRLDSVELHYFRFVTRLSNVSGLEDSSQIDIIFDPKIERLHLHSVSVKRGSQSFDQLRLGRAQVIQRESDLEDQLVDGQLTFHLVMSDVRVGDVIDYSYTIERRNAEWGNRGFGRLVTQWDSPVGLVRIRLLTPIGFALNTLSDPVDKPTASIASGLKILEWSQSNVAAVHFEKEAPRWFLQYGAIEFSQFADWGSIVAAAVPLYSVAAAPSSELKALTSRFASATMSNAQRAVEVMKFVQEEIRYTGIEEGEGAYRPTQPNEVLARRFGDCKDKTLLAVTLLRALGIEAAPALVSTRWRGEVSNHLPSPGLMNHAVVRTVIDGQVYWFDATATGQGGQLSNFTHASFGKSLVISPGVTAWESMPAANPSKPQIQSRYVFDLSAGWFAESSLLVTTLYLGEEADRMRRRLRSKGSGELAENYLRYYKGEYSGVRSAEPLKVTDNLDANELGIVENYLIKDAFETDKQGEQKLYVNPDTITEELAKPGLTERITPLAMEFPKSLSAQIKIVLPTQVEVDAETIKIDTPNFHYASSVAYRDKVVTLEHEYKTLTDHVPAAGLAAHLKDLERARDDTYFHVMRNPKRAEVINQKDSFFAMKLVAGVAALFLLLRLLRKAVTVQVYLASSLKRVKSRSCAEEEVSEKERRLLKSIDDEFASSKFEAAGFVESTALFTQLDKPDYFRAWRRSDSPMTAYVARHLAPEYGTYVRAWLETDLADGSRLQTTDGSSDANVAPPRVLLEALRGASPSQLIKRHEERLQALGDKVAAAQQNDLAERLTGEYAAIRTEWLRKEWIREAANSDLDRVTLKGAFGLTRVAARIGSARASGPALLKASQSASPSDRSTRADADFVAAWHLSRMAQSAPGANFRLIAFTTGGVILCVLVPAALYGLYPAAILAIALLIHELTHLAALGGRPLSTGLLFFLPNSGLRKAEATHELPIADRAAIILSAPLAGLLIGVLLLWAEAFWPGQYLRSAAHIFIGWNALLLVPYAGSDGYRLLCSITALRSVMRPLVQIASAAAMLVLGLYNQSQVVGSLGFLFGVWTLRQLPSFNLTRSVARQIPRNSDWNDAAHAACVAMTQAEFARWRAAIRQLRAIAIADDSTRPALDQRGRILAMLAFLCCGALALCAVLRASL